MWEVLAELSAALGDETGIDSAPEALAAIAEEVPFYAGITHEEIGGGGVRWQDREAAARLPQPSSDGSSISGFLSLGTRGDEHREIRVGTYRDLWAAEVTEQSPALRFLMPRQTLELAPADAERIGIGNGEEVEVRSNGTSVQARVALRERVRPGSGFLIEGLGDAAASLRGEPAEISRAEPAD